MRRSVRRRPVRRRPPRWPAPRCGRSRAAAPAGPARSFSSNQLQHTLGALSPTLRGSLLAATALALVGSPVAASDLVEGYPLAAGQALRYSAAGLALLVVARGRLPRLQARELVGLIALSATGLVLFNLFVIEGVRETDPATIGVIVGRVPVVLALAGPLLEG